MAVAVATLTGTAAHGATPKKTTTGTKAVTTTRRMGTTSSGQATKAPLAKPAAPVRSRANFTG